MTPTPSPSLSSQPQTERLKVRLAGYPRKHNEGRIELFYKGEWGTICDDDFSISNANVLCRQLGFVSATGWTHSAKYGKGQGKIWLDNVLCNGGEKSIEFCKSRGWGNSDCTHDEDAGVVCKDERIPGFVDSNVIDAHVDENKVEEVRLRPVVAMAKKRLPITEGVVEVKYKDGWAQICDVGWTIKNTHVICGMLGFPHERKVNKNFYKGHLSSLPLGSANGATCVLHRRHQLFFVSRTWALFPPTVAEKLLKPRRECQGGRGRVGGAEKQWVKTECAVVADSGQPASSAGAWLLVATSLQIRIVGGRSNYEGRVEVQVGSKWGTVCSTGWTTKEAMVVCRQLGLGYSMHAITETWYWDSSNVTEMVMSGVKCTGNEMALSQCQHHKTVSCQKAAAKFSAGVICSETASDLVLNAPLVEQTVYIEDRPLHMLYCAAEEDCLSKSAAKANWPYGHRRLLRFSSQIHNIGRADFKPKAGRHSWVWHACHGHYHSMDIFTHYDLLSANGTKVAEGHKASFCLEDTDCQEGVSKRYECANFGDQGITVGCWDLYRHDIDCQWIDITDVKPGNYIMQVVINPNHEVAESDFTNNAMKCNCKYDGHRIWFHNCHIGDAFSEEAERRFEKYPGQNNQIS
ncbi:lysyl oxidase homolog 3 isoform X2 [Lates japonicus]|uniref:Lysyl oxidase homolog n=1 Tax=Lates japonicus TaxID=270547 RepID=A0AAD3QVK0_LATJO|nr:lysyl oxidase homolog 3 isoform X2 [Lates japonicus]